MTSGERPIELNLQQLRQSYAELRIIEKKRLAQLRWSLKRYGQQSSVLVVASEEADRYVLLRLRFFAAREDFRRNQA